MKCTKCQGLMLYEQFKDHFSTERHEEFMGWRCVSCGRIWDRTIHSREVERKKGGGSMMKTIYKIFSVALLCLIPVSASAEPDSSFGDHDGPSVHPMTHFNIARHRHPRFLHPHNAAIHFLQMQDALKLTDKQVSELKTLRDSYRAENTVTEAKLKMAEEELQEMLFEPSIDSAKADQKIRDIQSLKGSLWTSFVEQLARIKTIIPPEQMKNLHDMRYHHNREKR